MTRINDRRPTEGRTASGLHDGAVAAGDGSAIDSFREDCDGNRLPVPGAGWRGETTARAASRSAGPAFQFQLR